MPVARNGDVEIYYETIGDDADPAVLLVAGLGAQLISWAEEWCQAFADVGSELVVILPDLEEPDDG